MQVQKFTFGPFQENTYVLSDETKSAVIIDPGCFTAQEENELQSFISGQSLKVEMLLNTHAHLDHIAGNKFVFDIYGLQPIMHKDDLPILDNQLSSSTMYGLPCNISPRPLKFISDGEIITFGKTNLKVIHAPGHAPGHVVFYHMESSVLINGDVLFSGSIGRTDLPLGNHETLIKSIKTKLFVLPDNTLVYTGHGPETTIGREKISNPFLV